jgi:hypothetical protein
LLLHALAGLTLVLTAGDHWTTYLCLRRPVAGWEISEANPLADGLFQAAGLVPGLALDSAVTIAAVGFLVVTTRFAPRMKMALLTFISITAGYATTSNLLAMSDLGLSVLGAS